jgi:alanyl-tRNA synthetase
VNTQETRNRFIDYFRERGHERVSSGSLIPPRPDDPVLFVTSGMHPLIPHLQGEPHPQGKRLVNSQRCLRTTDLDEVGDSTHLTVFEMLGSWSLGGYRHEQSLRWGWELMIEGFGVEPRRVSVTVFGGDERCDRDVRSEQVWSEVGLPSERIVPLITENWWTGPDGMCGPDSEMFVWTGRGDPEGSPSTDGRWVEVWNHVSMRYRENDGELVELPQRCVDTGMGLERMLMVLQGVGSVYDTDLLISWTRELDRLWRTDTRRRRLLTDHLRSVTVMCSDGVRPSNTSRGYGLRRLIRRTLTELWDDGGDRTLGDLPDGPFSSTIELMGLRGRVSVVRDILLSEERRFRSLIERGRSLVERELRRGPLGESELRYLHDTHGLPPNLVLSLVEEVHGG